MSEKTLTTEGGERVLPVLDPATTAICFEHKEQFVVGKEHCSGCGPGGRKIEIVGNGGYTLSLGKWDAPIVTREHREAAVVALGYSSVAGFARWVEHGSAGEIPATQNDEGDFANVAAAIATAEAAGAAAERARVVAWLPRCGYAEGEEVALMVEAGEHLKG